MNQLSYIRSRINALRRKFALEISHNRLRPMVEDFCIQSYAAAMDRKPLPDGPAFLRKVADAGFRLPTYMAGHKYLAQCLADKVVPGVENLLGALLPWAIVRGLVVLSADPKPPTPVPARA